MEIMGLSFKIDKVFGTIEKYIYNMHLYYYFNICIYVKKFIFLLRPQISVL